MNNSLTKALFWGALWGFAEATVGFAIHKASIALPGLPGFVMFPLAFFFMHRAIESTGSASSAFLAALVAASIKLADFFVPAHDALRIINPVLSILAEGLAVYAIILYCRRKGMAISPVQTFLMGFTWRGMFSLYLFAISLFGLPAALITDGLAHTLRFLLLESAVNALLIHIYLGYSIKPSLGGRFILTPGYALGALALAVAAQLAL